jgi:hypothetical protein
MAIMNAMPEHYIVTTTTYPPGSPMPSGRIRTEAATLEEARETALRIASKHEGNTWSPAMLAACRDFSGEGTVGPLRDGTMIEVRPA